MCTVVVTSKTLSNLSWFVHWLTHAFDEVILNRYMDGLSGDALINFIGNAECVIVGTEKMDKYVLKNIPTKQIVKFGVGIDNIDFEACKKYDINVYYQKGSNSNAVAELTISYMIQLLRNQHISCNAAKLGKWNKVNGKELSEANIGIIGIGNVGLTVYDKLHTLSSNGSGLLMVNDICIQHELFPFYELDEILKNSDLITFHIDNENNRNYHFIDDKKLSLMQDGAYLINTSRGAIMDYCALEKHLPRLGGIALDVFPEEPEIPDFLSELRREDPPVLTGGMNRRHTETVKM